MWQFLCDNFYVAIFMWQFLFARVDEENWPVFIWQIYLLKNWFLENFWIKICNLIPSLQIYTWVGHFLCLF